MQKKSYSKVNEYIWEKVLNGELKLGDKLPPEREFAKMLDISRNSIREGLRVLENVGVISSQQGAGNFISANFEETLVEIMSFMYTLNGMNDCQITQFRYALEWEAVNLITGKVPEEIKEKRWAELTNLQAEIAERKNEQFIGQEVEVMIDGISSESEYMLEGRTRGQALEIDGKVLTNDGTAKPGDIVRVKIEQNFQYDFIGPIVEEE